jgi:hypothetical protein
MRFKAAPTEPNFDRFKLVSEGGEWELGLWSVMFGVRVRFGRTGAGGVELDYCAGADPLFQMELLNAVHIILLEIPETVTESELRRIFPDFHVKPINLDPYCWPEIQRMRDAARARLGIMEEFYPLAA